MRFTEFCGSFWRVQLLAGAVSQIRSSNLELIVEPSLSKDGEHVFTVESIFDRQGNAIPGAAGRIIWSAEDGLKFHFEIPHESPFEGVPSSFGMSDQPPTGLSEVTHVPSWSGVIDGGGKFMLFGAGGIVDTKHQPFRPELGADSTVDGRAALGSMTFPLSCPLAFRDDTPNHPRDFVPSFSLLPWPTYDQLKFVHGDVLHTRLRGKLVLESDPPLTIYQGTADPGARHGVWVVDEGPLPESERSPSEHVDDARSFLSYLVGRDLPIHWRDRFPDESNIRRLYMGARRATSEIQGNEQPLPLYGVAGSLTHGRAVAEKLPTLFSRFERVRRDYNLEFVLSPIWAAFDGYFDDRLALGCVSLERLATAHGDHLKKLIGERPKTEFLTTLQSKAFLKALAETADDVAKNTGISGDNLRILKNKLNNAHQPPNADKLAQAFQDIGLELSEEERKTLDNRNRALHGRATMVGEDIASVEADLRRFDILRTLIHKAVLGLLDYDGMYVDYGDRQAGTNYTVKHFVRQPKKSVPALADSDPQ
jgi:hypothetical protein